MYVYRHLAGEDLSKLGMRELKQLERQLKIGIERVHSKKVYINPFCSPLNNKEFTYSYLLVSGKF